MWLIINGIYLGGVGERKKEKLFHDGMKSLFCEITLPVVFVGIFEKVCKYGAAGKSRVSRKQKFPCRFPVVCNKP